MRTLTGHKSSIRSLDFHPYGDFVASGSMDTNIKVCDENMVLVLYICSVMILNIPSQYSYVTYKVR